jgi:hypothetical protein
MFNWFGTYKDSVYEVPMVPVPDSGDGYTVGIANNGNTMLQLQCNGSITTLTMNKSSVRQMVRLLEATLNNETEEENV